MISYEVSIGLIIIAVVLCVGSLSLSEIVIAQENIPFIFPLFPAAIMFFVSVLAETNRVPRLGTKVAVFKAIILTIEPQPAGPTFARVTRNAQTSDKPVEVQWSI